MFTARQPSAGELVAENLERQLIDLDQLERKLTGLLQDTLPTDVAQANDMMATFKVCLLLLNAL